MKKLQVIIMVLMLCTIGATVARAGLVAGYTFEGSLCDCSGNDYDGQWCGPIIPYSSDVPPSGSGDLSLRLDGDNCVTIPVDGCIFEGDTDFSIVFWFKTTQDAGVFLGASSAGGGMDEHCMSITTFDDNAVTYDNWWTAAASTETTGLNDGAWHHFTIVHSAPGTQTCYLNGVEDGGGEVEVNLDCNGTTVVIGSMLSTAWWEEWEADVGMEPYNGLLDDIAIYDHALTQSEVTAVMAELVCYGCPVPCYVLDIDPNVMVVYETGETIGDFDVSLRCEPNSVVTVTVDPDNGNGPNDDLTLIGGSGPQNRITLTFDPNNWYVPQTVLFQAVDDALEEGPDIDENHTILLTTSCADPNWDGRMRDLTVTVQDNDQANILFAVSPPNLNNPKMPITGPVKIWEEPAYYYGYPDIRKKKIWVTLQVPPLVGGDPCLPTSVKLQAEVTGEIEGNNLPKTDPCLPYEETDVPNGLIFTAANYDVPQAIKIWGNDDEVLQAVDATSEGDQNYQADLVFTVIDDGGDERFTGMERTVQFDIEDNECGAFGISYLDVGNPNAFTDPNFLDENGNPLPDCHIDIYDVVEMAVGWLKCTNPQDENCQSML